MWYAYGWQNLGGGLSFWEGTATLNNTNVYKNQAAVCSNARLFNLP